MENEFNMDFTRVHLDKIHSFNLSQKGVVHWFFLLTKSICSLTHREGFLELRDFVLVANRDI